MEISRSKDYELINSILNDPIIFSTIAEDGVSERGSFETTESDEIYYLIPRIFNEEIGVLIFHPDSKVSYKIHANILKEYRHLYSREAIKAGIRWVFDILKTEKINCDIPSIYENVIKCAIDCGFKYEGVRSCFYLKDGKALDVVFMGIKKVDWV